MDVMDRLAILRELERKGLWLSTWTIHTVSTNLGGRVNRRGIVDRRDQADVFRELDVPDLSREYGLDVDAILGAVVRACLARRRG